MKNSKQLLKSLMSILILTFFTNSIYADGGTETRNQCHNANWNYKAKARAWCFPCCYPAQTKIACNNNTGEASANAGNGKAWQKASNGPSGTSLSGGTKSWRCGRGTPLSDLYLSCDDFDSSGREGHSITTGNIQFNSLNKHVVINDISGYFNNSFIYIESIFDITIWLPSNEYDSIVTPGKVKWQGTITISNGIVSASNFTQYAEYNVSNDSGKTVSFLTFDKEINLSTLSSEDFGNLQVNITCHTIDHSGQFGEFVVSVSEPKMLKDNVNFIITKSKYESIFNFIYSDNTSTLVTLELFDINGKRIYSEVIKCEDIGKIEKEIILSNIPNMVIARIETNDNKVYYKKFTLF